MKTNDRITFSIITRKQRDAVALYVRIKYINKQSEICTGISINNSYEYNSKEQKLVDKQKQEKLEEFLDQVKGFAFELQRHDRLKHPSDVKMAFKTKTIKSMNLLSLFDKFLRFLETEVKGGVLSQGTLKNYYTTQKFLTRFIKDCYSRKDISILEYDRMFIDQFNQWMMENTSSENNGRVKHFERLKRFTSHYQQYEMIKNDPFLGLKLSKKVKPRTFLTEEEVDDLRDLENISSSLRLTRDMFLFMALTGLSYSDLAELSEDQIERQGEQLVIRGNRKKTKIAYTTPLFDEALQILNKYKNHYLARKKGTLLPVYCNQTFNRNLKRLTKLATIDKPLSSHCARHSFATLALTAGVPLVTIQHVLGHADIRMTQHYSRLIDKKLLGDMQAFGDHMREKPSINHPVKLRVIKPDRDEKHSGT